MQLAGINTIDASAITPDRPIAEQMAVVVKDAGTRLMAIRHCSGTHELDRLIAAGAWTDAALKLLALELPQWQVRRLAYDEGEWHCALSRSREMPDWLDECMEASHADMAMAILRAIVVARETNEAATVPVSPNQTDNLFTPMCCDNFV